MTQQLTLLAARLKACPTRDTTINPQGLLEVWQTYRNIELASEVTPAVLVGLILYCPERLAPLLPAAELTQLAAIAGNALERYQQRIHPSNPVGTALAGAFEV